MVTSTTAWVSAWGWDLDADEHFQHHFCAASASIQVKGQAHTQGALSPQLFWYLLLHYCSASTAVPVSGDFSSTFILATNCTLQSPSTWWRTVHLQCGPTCLPQALESHLLPCDNFNDHACGCEQKIIILGAGCVHVCVCVRFLLCWISSLVQETAQLCPVKTNTEEEREHTAGPQAFFGLNCFTNHSLWVVHPVISHLA